MVKQHMLAATMIPDYDVISPIVSVVVNGQDFISVGRRLLSGIPRRADIGICGVRQRKDQHYAEGGNS